MKLKKRIWIVLPVLIALIVAAVAGYGYFDRTVNEYQLNALLNTPGTPQSITTGEAVPLEYTIINKSYVPITVREIVMVSVYGEDNTAVMPDGYGAVQLCAEETQFVEGVQSNHIVFSTQRQLESGKKPASKYSSEYILETKDLASYLGQKATVQVDVFLLGKPQAYPYAQWETLDHKVLAIENGEKAEHLPDFTNPTAFHWERNRNEAYLSGIGTVKSEEITLPTVICLRETADGWVEDPIRGTFYDVVIAGDAFYECDNIRTVAFPDGARVEDNAMHDGLKGMFESCYALEAVYNIPEEIRSLDGAFKNCTAMKHTPVLPDFVQSMDYCFYNCTALTEVTNLPAEATVLTDCFRNCTALEEPCALPDGVEDLSYCFYGCTALKTAPTIPQTVVNMKGCFAGCSSLKQAPALPGAVIELSECFMDCSALESLPQIPSSVALLQNCFKNCAGIKGTVAIPATWANEYKVTMIQGAFFGCSGIERVVFETCTNVDTRVVLDTAGMESRNVIYQEEHLSSGHCTGCGKVNGYFDGNGVRVYADNTPAEIFMPFLEFVRDEIPAQMKESCAKLMITRDLQKYYPGVYRDSIKGFAHNPYGNAYVSDWQEWWFGVWNPLFDEDPAITGLEMLKYATYHELGHCLDFNYSNTYRFSETAAWIRLFETEKELLGTYENYEPYEYYRESFARAIECYYMQPEDLKEYCPGMYAYLDHLLGEEDAA